MTAGTLARADRQVADCAAELARTVAWLTSRRTGGAALMDQQAIRFDLARLHAEIEGTAALTAYALELRAQDDSDPVVEQAACYRAARLLRRTAHTCLHYHGATGYAGEHPVQRLMDEALGEAGHCHPAEPKPGAAWRTTMGGRPEQESDSVTDRRLRIRTLLKKYPEVFAPERWDGTGQPPPVREALLLLGGDGLLNPGCVELHEELALLPVGAAVLTQVEVAAKLLSSVPAGAAAARQTQRGRLVAALAVTEPGGGMDFDAMTTTVRRTESGLEVNGEKWLSSNAPFADELLVLARDPRSDGIGFGRHTLLRIGATAPGVTISPLRTLGHRGLTGRIRLEGVRVADDALLGPPGTGLLHLFKHWVHERVMLAVRMTAMSAGILRLLEQSAEAAPPDLAGLRARLLQEQAALRRALNQQAASGCTAATAAGCKLRAADLLRRTAEAAHAWEFGPTPRGGAPLHLDPADPGLAERAVRDVIGLELAGGSTEALLLVLARELG